MEFLKQPANITLEATFSTWWLQITCNYLLPRQDVVPMQYQYIKIIHLQLIGDSMGGISIGG